METALILTFLVRYIAFFAAVLLVGALVISTLFIVVKNRVLEGEVIESGSLGTRVSGSAA